MPALVSVNSLELAATAHGVPHLPRSSGTTGLLDRCGPYAPLVRFLLYGLPALSAWRLLLMAWQWERVAAQGAPGTMLLQGLRCDLIVLGWWLAPIALVLPVFLVLRWRRLWTALSSAWLVGGMLLILFLELSTPTFIAQYDLRPNRLFLEYLRYPREVLSMLADGFAAEAIVVMLGAVGIGALLTRGFVRGARADRDWPARRTLMLWPLLALLLFAMIRSSAQHRPANLATFALFDDGMVNSLVANSTYTVIIAAYELRYEAHSSDIYGRMPLAEMVQRARSAMGVSADAFVSDEFPTLHRQLASRRREQPLNLVIVLEESLGAGFVGRLGGDAITPHLDALASRGIWFEQLYATGTRSVRGIEAVVAGFPPTPAQSTVKLSKSQRDFATLASLLRSEGYTSEFVYGGESHFDNMRGFFLGNGFERVVDQADFSAPRFVGDWGVSDEDLFDKTDERLQALHSRGAPFFLLAFSSSNHEPFQFPDGRIALADPQRQSVRNAVKYADHALGRFFEQARTRDYWRDTLFLLVSDHDVRVYGPDRVPVNRFHIPGLILGADIEPLTLTSAASQIDLAPTLLSLMGVDSTHPFPGRDLTRTLAEFGNTPAPVRPRALMQFNDDFAWLEDGVLTVLTPDDPDPGDEGRAYRYRYDAERSRLHALPEPDEEARRKVLAQALLPAWLYGEGRYRIQVPPEALSAPVRSTAGLR